MNSIKCYLISNQHKLPHNIGFKTLNNIITLADQEEACKTSRDAFIFARDVLGADIKKCQEVICKDSWYAYCFALLKIPEVDIEKCQEAACKEAGYAFWFAEDIQGADIEYCRKACENDEYWKNEFDKNFPRKQSA